MGWYNGIQKWNHEHPFTTAISCTIFTLFFAWSVFDQLGKSNFYAVNSFAWGTVACVCAVHYFKAAHYRRRRNPPLTATWPVVEGYIAKVEENGDGNFPVITLAYTYVVEGERYAGTESFAFVRDDEAVKFENGCRERTVKVHYRSDKPSVSVLDRESMLT